MKHPSTGPLRPDELKALADAPYGEAAKAIRKHDPLFGYKEADVFDWLVTFEGWIAGYAYVKGASVEEAKEQAAKIKMDGWGREIEWDHHEIAFVSVASVELETPPHSSAKAVPATPSLFQRKDGVAFCETAQSEPKDTAPP